MEAYIFYKNDLLKMPTCPVILYLPQDNFIGESEGDRIQRKMPRILESRVPPVQLSCEPAGLCPLKNRDLAKAELE